MAETKYVPQGKQQALGEKTAQETKSPSGANSSNPCSSNPGTKDKY